MLQGRPGSGAKRETPGLVRLSDPSRAPPALLDPFAIPFPTELLQEHPGLHAVMSETGATPMECGMTSEGPGGALQQNQCLYLSLAAASRAPGASLQPSAQFLRTSIEAAVRRGRPNWAEHDFLGQEVGAFADFLIWGIPQTPRLRGRAVAIYNEAEGTCEVVRTQGNTDVNAPVFAVWFSGSHYRWVRWATPEPGLAALLALHQGQDGGPDRVPTIITDTRA